MGGKAKPTKHTAKELAQKDSGKKNCEKPKGENDGERWRSWLKFCVTLCDMSETL